MSKFELSDGDSSIFTEDSRRLSAKGTALGEYELEEREITKVGSG